MESLGNTGSPQGIGQMSRGGYASQNLDRWLLGVYNPGGCEVVTPKKCNHINGVTTVTTFTTSKKKKENKGLYRKIGKGGWGGKVVMAP